MKSGFLVVNFGFRADGGAQFIAVGSTGRLRMELFMQLIQFIGWSRP